MTLTYEILKNKTLFNNVTRFLHLIRNKSFIKNKVNKLNTIYQDTNFKIHINIFIDIKNRSERKHKKTKVPVNLYHIRTFVRSNALSRNTINPFLRESS